jgi:Holliday junction resolvase
MTPERKVKKQVVETLKRMGSDVYYFFPVANGYGRSGIPDIIGCYRGMFFAIECKAGKNTTTALQDKELKDIKFAQGAAWVVNEEDVHCIGALIVLAYAKWNTKEV